MKMVLFCTLIAFSVYIDETKDFSLVFLLEKVLFYSFFFLKSDIIGLFLKKMQKIVRKKRNLKSFTVY